jgi:hypothetical protein
MSLLEWLRDKGIKGPLIISGSWKCDPEIWLVKQIKKVIGKAGRGGNQGGRNV